jgi:hypothetical protein
VFVKGEIKMSDINLQEVFNELQKDILHPEDIIDNKLLFRFDNLMYRIKMPSQKDIVTANALRNEKFVELATKTNDEGKKCNHMQKDWIKILKEVQNIDIEVMNAEVKDLEGKLQDTYLSLAKCKDGEEKMIAKIKGEIEEIRNKRMELIIERAGLLAPSIENQAQDVYYNYLTSKCTEVLTEDEKDEWKSVWKNFPEFENDQSKLTYVALGKLTELMMNI